MSMHLKTLKKINSIYEADYLCSTSGWDPEKMTDDVRVADCKRCLKIYKADPKEYRKSRRALRQYEKSLEHLAASITDSVASAEEVRAMLGITPKKVDKNHCGYCGRFIEVAIFRGEGFCSDDHRKLLGKDIV